jgi:hypothetical protein
VNSDQWTVFSFAVQFRQPVPASFTAVALSMCGVDSAACGTNN